MHTLTIRDLSVTEELDHKAMGAVRGGMLRGFVPYWTPSYSVSERSFSVDASQLIGQTQNVVSQNGNNVAFADDIRSIVKPSQSASNNISF
jgi:hypothetical protein